MNKHLSSLQYMRGVAAALVVLAHSIGHPLPYTPFDMLQLGRLGVTIFFVISGFIMVTISGETFGPLRFLTRRAIRILPLYWGMTFLAAALAVFLPTLFRSTVFTWPSFIQSLLFIPHRNPADPSLLAPMVKLGWTLNFEVLFYLMFAACFWLSAVRRVAVLSLVLVTLTALGLILHPQNVVGRFYLYNVLVGFAAGMWLGLAYVRGRVTAMSAGAVSVTVVAGIAALIAAFLVHRQAPPFTVDRYLLMVAFSVAILLAGVWMEGRGRLPHSPVLEAVGDASYSIYLAHMFWIGALVSLAHRLVGKLSGVPYLMVVALGLIGGVGGGILVYRLFERPMLKFLNARRQVAFSTATSDLASVPVGDGVAAMQPTRKRSF